MHGQWKNRAGPHRHPGPAKQVVQRVLLPQELQHHIAAHRDSVRRPCKNGCSAQKRLLHAFVKAALGKSAAYAHHVRWFTWWARCRFSLQSSTAR